MNIKKLSYIDAARGIAILMVMFVHTAQSVAGLSGPVNALAQYGQMGVQLFFVASAYTLCRTFRQRSGEPIPIQSFFMRRFFRIAPLYYFGIALYLIIHLATVSVDLHHALPLGPYSPQNVAANILFIHGFVPSAINSIVPGGWSIGTEMAFYVCFPVLYSLFAWLGIRKLGSVIAVIGVMLVVSATFAFAAGKSGHGIAYRSFLYYNLINQLPVFMVGMGAFFLQQEAKPVGWLQSAVLQWLGFVFLSGVAIVLWDVKPQVLDAVKPTIAGLSFFFLVNLLRLWSKPPTLLCTIGRVSFSMYLFHFIFAKVLLIQALKTASLTIPPDIILLGSFSLVCGGTLLLALLTEKTIERRGIDFGNAVIAARQAAAQEK